MIQIVLPVPPQRGNARGHWRIHQREKEAYHQECGWILKKFHRYEFKSPFEYVEFEASMDVQRFHDFDNLVSRMKWAFDVLQPLDKDKRPYGYGIIQSDDWLHCRPRSFPTQVLKSKKSDKRELRITLYPRGSFE